MAAFKNQRTITYHRAQAQAPYLKVKTSQLFDALKELGPSAFAVYLFFLTRSDGYKEDLSPAAIINHTGVCRNSVYAGIQTLLDTGYLIQKGSFLNFYDVPRRLFTGTDDDGNSFERRMTKTQLESFIKKECPDEDIDIESVWAAARGVLEEEK